MAEGYGPAPGPPSGFSPGPVPDQLILIQLTRHGASGSPVSAAATSHRKPCESALTAAGTPSPRACQGGADTAARYFRAGSAENAAVIERVFSD
jgi:hypothetical protein